MSTGLFEKSMAMIQPRMTLFCSDEDKKGAYSITHSQNQYQKRPFLMFGKWSGFFSIAGKDSMQLEK